MSVKYFDARFVGGPLDGESRRRRHHEGINDGFWIVTYVTENAVYEYQRVQDRFMDSDYVLKRVTKLSRPAAAK